MSFRSEFPGLAKAVLDDVRNATSWKGAFRHLRDAVLNLQAQIDELQAKRNYCYQCGYWRLSKADEALGIRDAIRAAHKRGHGYATIHAKCENVLVPADTTLALWGCKHFVHEETPADD